MAGITNLVQEISGSSKRIQSIDEQNIKLLFAYGDHSFITIIIEGYSLILHKMLEKLMVLFEANYSAILENWDGNIDVFKSAREIVNSIFSRVEWKTPLR